MVGALTIEKIVNGIEKRMPFNLTEVRLINCKISSSDTFELITSIQETNIRKLSLVNASLNSDNFSAFLHFVSQT